MRGAIGVLEEVGFLDRAVISGSTHKPTPDGQHRKPVLFVFGSEFGVLFGKANRRAQAIVLWLVSELLEQEWEFPFGSIRNTRLRLPVRGRAIRSGT